MEIHKIRAFAYLRGPSPYILDIKSDLRLVANCHKRTDVDKLLLDKQVLRGAIGARRAT